MDKLTKPASQQTRQQHNQSVRRPSLSKLTGVKKTHLQEIKSSQVFSMQQKLGRMSQPSTEFQPSQPVKADAMLAEGPCQVPSSTRTINGKTSPNSPVRSPVIKINFNLQTMRRHLNPFEGRTVLKEERPETSYSLPVSALLSPPIQKIDKRLSVNPDFAPMAQNRPGQSLQVDESNIEDQLTSRQPVATEAAVSLINSFSIGTVKTKTTVNTVTHSRVTSRSELPNFFESVTTLKSKVQKRMPKMNKISPSRQAPVQNVEASFNTSQQSNTMTYHQSYFANSGISRPASVMSQQASLQSQQSLNNVNFFENASVRPSLVQKVTEQEQTKGIKNDSRPGTRVGERQSASKMTMVSFVGHQVEPMLAAAQQLPGESNEDIDIDDIELDSQIAKAQPVTLFKSRNVDGVKQEVSFMPSETFKVNKPAEKEEHLHTQEFGTILSETNDVIQQLAENQKQPIRSPTKGKIESHNPDFSKILLELQMLDSDEDANILEQTLGRTLTQQKKILADINSQSSIRQRDFVNSNDLLRLQAKGLLDSALSKRDQPIQLLMQDSLSTRQKKQRRTTLLKLPQREVNRNRPSLINEEGMPLSSRQSDTQPADFSEIGEDSRNVDEAIEARNFNSKNPALLREKHASKTSHLIGVVPRWQQKRVNQIKKDEEQKQGSESEQLPPGRGQTELVMRLANLNAIKGSQLLMPGYQDLQIIDLRNNRLSELPSELCSLHKLTHIKVDYNYLAALPFSLGNLSNLSYLSVSQNRLLELPDSLFKHDSMLTALLVNDNKIIKLQRSLGNLKHLQQLYLHSNSIVELPTSFSQLTQLIEFSLDWLAYIEKTKEELEEMQGIPQNQDKEILITMNDQPVSARKYFESNANETQECQEGTKYQPRRIQEDLSATRKVLDLGQTSQFALSIAGNKKLLKGEKGLVIFKELRLFCKLVENIQKSMMTTQTEHSKVHFIQFLMYFQCLGKLSEVKDFVYRHKQRSFLHQMGINGHIYLLQASIATLGMQRSTSFNINKTDEDNSTVLVLALRQKRLEFVKYLLRLPQISTTIYSHKYGLPLHVALHQSEFNLALKLLKRQDQLKTPEESVELDVNVPNEQGNTAMHLLFINFSQDPELAAQVAKILIKKGANLRAKNKNELGLLHAAVNNGTIKALEFARDHNRMLRAKRNKTSDLADAQFQFNMKGGQHEWTLLHYAIHATNLPVITFLLDCDEFTDLTERDTNGRRAIDLCPFSSPIFKSIRSQVQRRALALVVTKSTKEENEASTNRLEHTRISSRECIFRQVPMQEVRALQKIEPLMHHFESVHTNASAQEDPYQHEQQIYRQFNRFCAVQAFKHNSRQPLFKEPMQAYGVIQPGQMLSSSFADSTDDRFDLYNSQAASFPFSQPDSLPIYSMARIQSKHDEDVQETATFIQNQPLNLTDDSPEQGIEESQDDMLADPESIDHHENVDDDTEQLGRKAYEARVSQWNRQASTQLVEEKNVNQLKLSLAHSIVMTFIEIRNARPEHEQPVRRDIKQHPVKPKPYQVVSTEKESSKEQESQPAISNFACDFQLYREAFKLNSQSLQTELQAWKETKHKTHTESEVILVKHELEQLVLLREQEAQQTTDHFRVINSTGRDRKLGGQQSYLARTKSQSQLVKLKEGLLAPRVMQNQSAMQPDKLKRMLSDTQNLN